MHVISTDENQVFAAVQEWNQNDTYNLYISDTRGVYFTLALENVKSSQDLEGNVMIDLYESMSRNGTKSYDFKSLDINTEILSVPPS
uniref:VPS10 domain-containing receptor SorCS1 n=1 Tax=Sphaerodactylus townsendi TaxID=933632 RepID=A0ACB8F9Q0_9SAUR